MSRRERKRGLTALCSSRWAGAITRTTDDAWRLAERNLISEARSLRARVGRLRRRLAVPCGQRRGRIPGYANPAERFEKQRRLQVLQTRLVEVEARLVEGRVSICRGGRKLARSRHQLGPAGENTAEWRRRWEAARWFITADGEADKAWGNETIRWHPDEGWLDVKLPAPLAELANRPHGRYRLSVSVSFPYRGDEVAAQAASGPVRYDIAVVPDRGRWYLDASWTTPPKETASFDELRRHPVLAIDLNAGHLAAVVVDPAANPWARRYRFRWSWPGWPPPPGGRVRAAISRLIGLAEDAGCQALVIEDLDFDDARNEGREHQGRRPSRGRRGRSFRRLLSGIPTARFRDRLVQMATNRHLAVVAVDPAYTSKWGAQHWLGALRQLSSDATGHHAAAVVIGRRGLGQRARRRGWCDSNRPEDRQERATNSAVRPTPDNQSGLTEHHPRKPGHHKARGQPPPRGRKTQSAEPAPPGNQAAQDRSGPPRHRHTSPR